MTRKERTTQALARPMLWIGPMPSIRITCPESAHLEEIELIDTPVGLLVQRCSAFAGGVPDCPRTCAARLDQRARRPKRLADGSVLIATSVLRGARASQT